MKRFIALLALAASLTSCSVMMQGSRDGVSVGAAVNISAQPPWGPAGYACAPYYYFPDFNIYYDVNRALFYYHSRRMSARTTSTNSIRLYSTYATRGSTTAHTAANTESIAAYTHSPYCVMRPATNIIPVRRLRRSAPAAGRQRHTATTATRCATCATTTSVPTTDKARAETTSHSQTNSKSNRRQRPSVRKRNSKARAATAMPTSQANVQRDLAADSS